jgi:hypothetical protein
VKVERASPKAEDIRDYEAMQGSFWPLFPLTLFQRVTAKLKKVYELHRLRIMFFIFFMVSFLFPMVKKGLFLV